MSIPRTIRATFMRGGTSKGVFLHERDLPRDRSVWPDLFARIMGSPCSHNRQLNGMGGGISSLSKICVIAESSNLPNVAELTFAQVGIGNTEVDFYGTCGNLMAAVPLFAVEEGIVRAKQSQRADELMVTIHDCNTAKTIRTFFSGTDDGRVDWADNYEISGVDGLGVKVATEYLDCGGTKTGKLWPTGNLIDSFEVDGRKLHASLVDGPNPAVLCDADMLGLDATSIGQLKDNTALLRKLESIRLQATVRMGIARDLADAARFQAIPKLCLLEKSDSANAGIRATTLSMGVPHKAIPVTIGLSLAIAMATPGTVAARLASGKRIHHPTGFLDVEAAVNPAKSAASSGVRARVMRSARRLMKGEIFL